VSFDIKYMLQFL